MNFELEGSAILVHLSKGEKVFTESSEVAWIQGDVDISTSISGRIHNHSGTLLQTNYECISELTVLGLGLRTQASLVEKNLGEGQVFVCRQDKFVVAEASVKIEYYQHNTTGSSVHYRKITGPGQALWEIPGGQQRFDLKEGSSMLANPNYLALFEDSIQLERVSMRGVKQKLGSDNDLMMIEVFGPGTVWLQNLSG